MNKRTVLVSMLAAIALSMSAATYAATNFSGTWVLDRAKSDTQRMGQDGRGSRGGAGTGQEGRGQTGRGPGGRGQSGDFDVTLTIKQTGNDLIITRKFGTADQARSVEMKYTLDGKENKNQAPMGRGGESVTKSKWKGDVLVIEGTQKMSTPRGDFDIDIKEEFALSQGGKVLTITNTRTTPDREQTNKQVYNKKP